MDSPTAHHQQLSSGSGSGEIPQTMPSAPLTSSATSHNPARHTSGGLSIGSLVNPTDYRSYTMGTPYPNAYGRPHMGFVSTITSSDDSNLFFTPESSQSPVSEHYGRYPHRQSFSSSSSVAGFDPSTASPLMNASGPWIPTSVPPTVLPPNMFEDAPYISVCVPMFCRAYLC